MMKGTKVTVNPFLRKSLREAFAWTSKQLKVPATKIDSAFRKHEIKVFATEGAAGGRKWKPLSTEYGAWKKKHFGNKKIMNLTGETRKSLTSKGRGHVFRYMAKGPRPWIAVGTAIPTPAYHIKPTGGRPNPLYNPRMPHRDTLAHTVKQMKIYQDIVEQYVIKVKRLRSERILKKWAKS